MMLPPQPILFTTGNVREILAGRKWKTRRLAWEGGDKPSKWQRWDIGSLAWVRESFRLRADQDAKRPSDDRWKNGCWYVADDPELEPSGCGGGAGKRRPGIHMPKWANRLTLLSTAKPVVERLQDITEEDCIAEGIRSLAPGTAFTNLWRHIHGRNSWEANPEVVVLEFSAYLVNVDRFFTATKPIERALA